MKTLPITETELKELAAKRFETHSWMDNQMFNEQMRKREEWITQFKNPVALISDEDKKEAREKIRKSIEGQLNVANDVGRMGNYNIAQMILTELEMYHNVEILYSGNTKVEELKRRIKSLEMLCNLASVPKLLIEGFSIGEINEDDISWAKKEIDKLKPK